MTQEQRSWVWLTLDAWHRIGRRRPRWWKASVSLAIVASTALLWRSAWLWLVVSLILAADYLATCRLARPLPPPPQAARTLA